MFQQPISTTFSSSPYFFDRGPYGAAQPITERIHPHSRPIVSYYYPKHVGSHHYGQYHPMKPGRLTLTNALVMGYGLDKQIHNIYDVRAATRAELESYHDTDYIDFLSRVTPGNQQQMKDMIETFNCVEDCPIFADMFDFCRMYAGGSLAGARKLCAGSTDIAINWSGGLHHAKRGEASGFCYVNDIVIAILEMLRHHPRVLYIDIDIHHGDGVELAFYQSDRVMTVSFHKYTGEFFPGTGKLDDNGQGTGKYYSLNVPLLDGIDDEMYLAIFKSVIGDAVSAYRPSAIVLQCGADSLGCDRLGAFNLSIAAHGECVNFVRAFNVPLLVVGGGGYTMKNVCRCWTYETSVLVGASIPNELPVTVYDSFFADSQWKLHPPLTGRVDNQNTAASLQHITTSIRSKLRYLQGAPSVALQEIPPDIQGLLREEERTAEEKAEEVRTADAGEHREDVSNARNEFYDGENDVDHDTVTTESQAPSQAPSRGGTSAKRGRGGRPSRAGRGRSKVIVNEGEDGAEDEEKQPEKPVSSRKTTKPRGRGRGRGRGGRRAKGRDAEDSAGEPDSDTANGVTMEVDEK
ncbi:histone deacetylase [Marasmius crinis-equi]|uniref:histone deacetylase n=1 Tax=Marasmius crinis-equi TaxID=585013 RepID=A0ABR3FLH8_9AGAR